MTKEQLAIREAAQNGELDLIDPVLLTPENFLHRNENGDFVAISEKDGPIQSAAFHGQLGLLPPEARTVKALLDCGHPDRNKPGVAGTFEDAFFASAMGDHFADFGLNPAQVDDRWNADIALHYREIEKTFIRAEAHLTALAQSDAASGVDYAEKANAVHDFCDTMCFYQERKTSEANRPLPEIASVPKISSTQADSGRGRGGV